MRRRPDPVLFPDDQVLVRIDMFPINADLLLFAASNPRNPANGDAIGRQQTVDLDALIAMAAAESLRRDPEQVMRCLFPDRPLNKKLTGLINV